MSGCAGHEFGKNSSAITLVLAGFLLLISPDPLSAQGASTYHVFPQFVDGNIQPGTFYRSTLFATNATSADASCTYQLYGIPNERLLPKNTFTLPANGGVIRASSAGNGVDFSQGYATLTCDRAVFSYVQFEYVSSATGVLGTASVYSAPPGLAAEFIFPTSSGYRLGIAIANDSDGPGQVNLRLGAGGGNELRTIVPIASHTRIARFIDEIFSLPTGFVPVALLIESTGSPAAPFNALGLTFAGPVFSTVPPLVFQQ
jgi:hypothetical protein